MGIKPAGRYYHSAIVGIVSKFLNPPVPFLYSTLDPSSRRVFFRPVTPVDEGDSRTDEGDSRTDEGDSRTDEGDSRTDEGDSRTDEGEFHAEMPVS